MTNTPKPEMRPACPHFSSGPTAKRPGFSLSQLETAAFGRSHRSKDAKAKLKEAIDRTKAILKLPEDYRVAIGIKGGNGCLDPVHPLGNQRRHGAGCLLGPEDAASHHGPAGLVVVNVGGIDNGDGHGMVALF